MDRPMLSCERCGRVFRSVKGVNIHQCSADIHSALPEKGNGFETQQHAFNAYLKVYKKTVNYNSFDDFFTHQFPQICEFLTKLQQSESPLKVQFCTTLIMIKPTADSIKREDVLMCTRSKSLVCEFDVSEIVEDYKTQMENSIDQFTQRGSGWILESVVNIEIRVAKYIQDQGGCFRGSLPPRISNKKACLELDCHDDCFMWSVLALLHPTKKNANRCVHYVQYVMDYDFSDVRGIVQLKSIPTFERKNNISVSVYTLEKLVIIPLKVARLKTNKHINLLLFEEHYYPIRNFNRLCGNVNWRRYWCDNCLSGFRSKTILAKHQTLCYNNIPQRIDTPSNVKLEFKDYHKALKLPFIIYADFETLVVERDTRTNYDPCSFGSIIINWDGDIIDSFFYRGLDAAQKFIEYLVVMRPSLQEILDKNLKPLKMTEMILDEMKEAQKCHICEKYFIDGSKKVADHDHLTGEFRGAAHNECNLSLRMIRTIPVVFHNFKNFDSHIIVQGLDHNLVNNVTVIPQSLEKYIAMKIDDFTVIDSYAFLASSLDDLSHNTDQSIKEKYLKCFFDDISLLTCKGTLPYEYLDSIEKFEETTFPAEEAFFSKLKNKHIDPIQYQNVKNIWIQHKCRNLGDLHDIYLKVDVILLAAVFEQFRGMSLTEFGLDPGHFYSSPGLTWAAALKYTKVEIELLKDIDMILMIENGIRGGISCAMTHYAKANNKYLPNYSPEEETSFITYLDVNNLYGFALKQPMPYSGFKWVPTESFNNVFKDILFERTAKGYILEVDIEFPRDFHDNLNDYPLAPEKRLIEFHHLSPYQQALIQEMKKQGAKYTNTVKLVPDLCRKKGYVIHYRNLQFYVSHGMSVSKIHRIIEFEEKPWIEPYINLCTSKRQQAKTAFQKDFWKLLVNSLFGKSIENKRKYSNIKVALNHNQLIKGLRNPLFDEFMILDQNKAFLKCRKTKVMMDKPIFLGFTVLELSKLHMYYLHYDVFKNYYGNNLKLIYTDTDSFIYHIKTTDIFRDFQFFSDIMDFCDYPKDHPLYSEINKKVLGKLKDEMAGDVISEVIALKSKMYYIDSPKKQQKRAKGVIKSVLEDEITKKMYLECLFKERVFKHDSRRISSEKHQIIGVTSEKISLTPLDDKRFSLNAVDTLAFGHYRIESIQNGD